MPAEQSDAEAPGNKYPDGSGDAADDDVLASELTIEELKEAFRWAVSNTMRLLLYVTECWLLTDPWSRLFDTGGEGYITVIRFREILIEIDEEFTEEELDGIIRDVSIHQTKA